MESSINYGMERVWSIGVCRGTNSVTVGYDEGVVLMKMGSEEPVASMDASGRIIYARHNDVHTAVIKALGADYELVDGERLPLPIKVCAAAVCDTFFFFSPARFSPFLLLNRRALRERACRVAPMEGVVATVLRWCHAYRLRVLLICSRPAAVLRTGPAVSPL